MTKQIHMVVYSKFKIACFVRNDDAIKFADHCNVKREPEDLPATVTSQKLYLSLEEAVGAK